QTKERNYWDALLLKSDLYSRADNTLGNDAPKLTAALTTETTKIGSISIIENFAKPKNIS
ncbi:MAG: hypothetical protein ACTSW4_07075, partial [Candidatus Ranarchaeia archaeon]